MCAPIDTQIYPIDQYHDAIASDLMQEEPIAADLAEGYDPRQKNFLPLGLEMLVSISTLSTIAKETPILLSSGNLVRMLLLRTWGRISSLQ